MSSPIELTGGAFQDAEGNALALGYLIFVLNQDSNVNGINICSGIEIKITLDADGNANSGQSIWGNDALSPINSFYRVTGYSAAGQPVWGPNNQQVVGSGTFNLGNWIPNQIFSWQPPTTSVSLETNSIPNSSQTILNLESGSGISIINSSNGNVLISASGNQQVGPRPALGNWHGWSASGTDSITTAPFSCSPISGGSTVCVAATSSEPCYVQAQTGATPSAQATFQSNANATSGHVSLTYQQMTLGIFSCYETRVQLTGLTTTRVWLGIGGFSGQGSTLMTDHPNEMLCAFRYSTNAGDTTWKCYCSTSSAAFTIVDSGVAVNTNGNVFQIGYDGTHVIFYINGAIVAQISTTLPSASQRLQDINSIDNVGTTNGLTLNTAYQYWETKV